MTDFSPEMLDLIHRIYEADESCRRFHCAQQAVSRPYRGANWCWGKVAPIVLLALTQVLTLGEMTRMRIYGVAGCQTLIGIFAMRWNVEIKGQLFSMSFLGCTTYQMGLVAREGLLVAIVLTILPFPIL